MALNPRRLFPASFLTRETVPDTVVEGLWGLVRVRFCGRLQESAFMFIYIYVVGLLRPPLGTPLALLSRLGDTRRTGPLVFKFL